MAFRSRRRRFRRRRSRRGRRSLRLSGRRNQRVSTTVVRPLITADCTIVRLNYGDSRLLLTGGPTDRISCSGNGLFIVDPAEGSTRQPTGFDEYIDLYQRYEVLSCSMDMKMQNLSAISPFGVAAYPTFDITEDVQFNDATSYPYSVTKYCGVVGSGAFQVSLRNSMATRKLFGRTTASINFTGTATSNPTQLWRWIFEIFSLDGSTVLTYRMQFNLTFTCKFFNRSAITDA